jgi:hypothetical protein
MKILLVSVAFAVAWYPAISSSGQDRKRPKQNPRNQKRDMTRLLGRFDKNKDGVLEKSELPEKIFRRLKASDANKDGQLSKEELKNVKFSRPSNTRPGEVITPAAKGERYNDTLKVGAIAPDFTLSDSHAKREVTLSSFRDQRPVVLIFGSYT